MLSMLFRVLVLVVLAVLPSCYSSLDESFPLDDREEAEPVAKDFFGNIQSGQIWSSPAGVNGLGGLGREVSLGELELPDSPPYPQQATLTLSLQTQQFVAFLGAGGRIYAKITYGVGAANQTVFLDWSTGTSINLPAGKVNVVACQTDRQGLPFLRGNNPIFADTIAVPIILTSSLTAGSRDSEAYPTLSQTIDIAAGVPAVLAPPPRAKGLLVSDARGQIGTDITVQVIGAFGVQGYALANAADSAIRTTGITMQGRVDNVQFNSPGGWNGIVVVWLLDG
jgi:hypothetical protein